MFGLGDFWDKSPLFFLKNFEIALVSLGQFQDFQKCTQTIHSKLPSQTCDYLYIFDSGSTIFNNCML